MVDAIVEATARILVRDGFDALAITDVAEVAGISVGSLYQYFPHKEALVVAVLEREADREAAWLAERFAAVHAANLEELLAALIRATLEFRADHRSLYECLLAIIPRIGRYYDLRARGVATAEGMKRLLAPHFPMVTSDDLDMMVYVIANATHALTHEGLLARPSSMTDEILAREATRLVVAWLRARADDDRGPP